jgi:hypothetical protein
VPSKTLGFSMLAEPVLVKGLSHFWIVGNLAKLMSNLIHKIESNNILVKIFMNMCDLTEYVDM